MRNFLNILSVVVLFGGVVAGVVLVQNEQDIRKSAAPEDKVKICHKTGNGEEFNQIEIAEQAVQSHLDHGDKLSGCDSQATQAETPAQTENPQATQESSNQNDTSTQTENTQSDNGTTENQENNNNSSSENTGDSTPSTGGSDNNQGSGSSTGGSTSSGTSSNNTNTFISPLNKNTFTFQFKLQGIIKSGVSKNITLTFSKSGRQSIRNLTAVSNSDGVFQGAISGLETGNYEVLVKPDYYLANRFRSINVTSGQTTWDWGSSSFRVGDFNNDNIINLLDVGMILAIYNQKSVTVNSSNRQYDVDANGVINADDIDIVLGNYSSLNVEGEK